MEVLVIDNVKEYFNMFTQLNSYNNTYKFNRKEM